MKTIRRNVFETNSSSEHVVTLLNDADYKDFEDGNCYYDVSEGGFICDKDWQDDVSGLEAEIKDLEESIKEHDWESDKNRLELLNSIVGITEKEVKEAFKTFTASADKYGVLPTSYEDDEESSCSNDKLSDKQNALIRYETESRYRLWTLKGWGNGYENSDDNSITEKGVTVHALSYSGYSD